MNNDKGIRLIGIVSFLVISLLGVLNHYLYDLLDKPSWIKFAVATDESVFQHMKLILYPWILTIIVLYYVFPKQLKNYVSSVLGLWIYILIIPFFYYLWTDTLEKEDNLTYDISIYFISVFISIVVWLSLCGLRINKLLDNVLTFSGYLVAIYWFTKCSYDMCPNIYEPEHSQD